MFRAFVLIFFLASFSQAFGEVIRFSDEELSKEAALPIFKKKEMVKNPRVKLKKHIEINLNGSVILTQPIYREYSFGGQVTYYFTERVGLGLGYYYWKRKLSPDGENLRDRGKEFGKIDQTPSIDQSYFADLSYTAFYGKISLSKHKVVNLLFYGALGGGGVKIKDTNKLAGRFTLGQKLYFSPNIALGLELAILFYNGPNALKESSLLVDRPVSDFQEKLFIQPVLRGGISFLF